MRIAYFIENIVNHGGTERIIIDKANYLAALPGYEVFLVCPGKGDIAKPAFPIDPRVKVYHLGEEFTPSCSLYKNPFLFTWQWIKWRRSLARKVNSLAKTLNLNLSISLAYDCTKPYRISGLPHIYESHAFRPEAESLSVMPKLMHWVVSHFFTKGATIVTLTKDDAVLWPEAGRVEIIPNFTNIEPSIEYNPASKKVIAAGTLNRFKGFDLLIQAWKKVVEKYPGYELEIFGADPTGIETDRYNNLINANGLTGKVHLRGLTDNMPCAYAEGCSFVLSSRTEGFGLVLIEAMACGIPPVAFDCPHGPSDLVDDGLNGILVPFKNLSDAERIDLLADGLCRMLALSDEEREQMSAEAMKKAASFSREAIMERWVKLFKEVAECE